MGSMRKLVGKIEGFLIVIMIGCIFGCIGSLLGLGLQLMEVVFGESDYSKWMITSIAEEPTKDLLIILSASTIGFFVCSKILDYSDD